MSHPRNRREMQKPRRAPAFKPTSASVWGEAERVPLLGRWPTLRWARYQRHRVSTVCACWAGRGGRRRGTIGTFAASTRPMARCASVQVGGRGGGDVAADTADAVANETVNIRGQAATVICVLQHMRRPSHLFTSFRVHGAFAPTHGQLLRERELSTHS